MIYKYKDDKQKNGFTLVELLAVIVILAIILVIAVPKVMSVIEDAKKATLESTAKMIASAAEKQKVQNTVLGKNDEITCDSVAKINNKDYASCSIKFDNNTAKVTIEGSGKFADLSVCDGTKENATTTNETCPVIYGIGSTYIKNLLAKESKFNNGLVQANIEYEDITYDAGIRYIGSNPNNKVYYNCEDIDSESVTYGNDNYDYVGSCEVWRIIGVFEVENDNGIKEKRIKIINNTSTFEASWDSSFYESESNNVNGGGGINEWGESTYEDGTLYKGSDLMQLLNGYYIEKDNSTCTYCIYSGCKTSDSTCTKDTLKNVNMKVLTNTAKGMTENVKWNTYAVNNSSLPTAYLEEKGISAQNTGITGCLDCNDGVIRTTSWTGLVGLMSISDAIYAKEWIYNSQNTWIITSVKPSAAGVWYGNGNTKSISSGAASGNTGNISIVVYPSVYLKPDIEIIDGNGDTEPYILSVN